MAGIFAGRLSEAQIPGFHVAVWVYGVWGHDVSDVPIGEKRQSLIRFAVYSGGSALLFAAVTLVAQRLSWISALPSYFYQSLIFVPFTTFVLFGYLFKVNKPEIFVQLYLLTMVVKFIAYGAYVFFVILDDKSGAPGNVVFFMLLYVFFTMLEVAVLFRKISPKDPQ
jgi:hypothetical protein